MQRADSIKNIIFDLGGVLLNIEPNLTGNALVEMGVKNMVEVHARLTEAKLYQRFDSGKCTPECFREEIRAACGIALTDRQVDDAWNALLLEFPTRRVEMLHQLNPYYRLFLLSNTNSIHYTSYTRSFRIVHGGEFSNLFEKLFLSFEMGVHKPDPEIYEITLKSANLVPGETLFIDDSLPNVEAAVKAGMNAFHLAEGIEVTDLFRNGKLREDAELLFP